MVIINCIFFTNWVSVLLDLTAIFKCGKCELFADGTSLGERRTPRESATFFIPKHTQVIAIKVTKFDGYAGRRFIGSFSHDLVTNESWKCSSKWTANWPSPQFNDINWPAATVRQWRDVSPNFGISQKAKWIWADGTPNEVYCRVTLSGWRTSLLWKIEIPFCKYDDDSDDDNANNKYIDNKNYDGVNYNDYDAIHYCTYDNDDDDDNHDLTTMKATNYN